MYCSACGAKLDPPHDACGSCGHRAAPRAAVTPGAVSTEATVSLPSYAEITASPIALPVADLFREAWGRAPIGKLILSAGVLMFVVLALLALPPGILLFPLPINDDVLCCGSLPLVNDKAIYSSHNCPLSKNS